MKMTVITIAALAAGLAFPAAAQDQAVPLSIDDSLICAGLFYAQSTLPENAGYAEGVEAYRSITATFLTRAEILAGRDGSSTEGHIPRAAEVAELLIATVDAAADPAGRYEVIATWSDLEEMCIAGGQQPA